MLSENIKALRKSKGLSQEDLAIKLNVVRQTISKWELGLSADSLDAITQKLEQINLQLARRKAGRRRLLHWLCFALCAALVAVAAVLYAFPSPYLSWDYSDPETAVLGVAFHACEWLFVRLAPIVLIGATAGYLLTRKKA